MKCTNNEFFSIAINIESASFDKRVLECDKVSMLIIHDLSQSEWWEKSNDDRVISQSTILQNKSYNALLNNILETDKGFLSLLKCFLSDYNTYHIFERKYSVKSLFELDSKAAQIFIQCYHWLKHKKIDLFITHDTPHSPVDFTFSKCAELLSIPIYNFRAGAIPWRVKIFENLGESSKLLKYSFYPKDIDLDSNVHSYLSSLKADYNNAVPSYEKERLIRNNNKIWNWKTEFSSWVKWKFNLKKLLGIIAKKYSFDKLQKLWTIPSPDDCYVAFYLHLQPERTTCPEGDIFNTPIIALNFLRALVPLHIKIFVREHPSTYTYVFNSKTRPNSFYDEIIKLPNTHLSSLEQDSFSFLDNSLFTSTITGTIAFGSAVRKKKCVCFGDAFFKGCPNTYHINEVLENENILSELLSEKKFDDSQIQIFIEEEFRYSYGSLDANEQFADYSPFQRNWIESLCIFLKSI